MSYQNGPRIVTNGLVLCLDAGNSKSYAGSGTSWTDLSGNGNNGTLTNGPTYSSANKGSISFDGVDDYIDISKQILKNRTEFTINITFFTSTLAGVLINEGNSSNVGVSWWLAAGTNATILQFGDGTNNSYSNSTITLSQNVWTNICFTYQNKTGTTYVNGISQRTYTNTNEISWHISNTTKLCTRESAASSFSNARVSNLHIYNRALSASEILQNYNATKGRFGL